MPTAAKKSEAKPHWFDRLTYWASVGLWAAGIILSKSFFSALIAILFPPYAWFLVVEYCADILGWFN